MYKKTFTIPLVSLILIVFSSFIARAQTYGPCNDVYVDVFTKVTGSDSDTNSKTFTLTTGRTVTIQYVIDFAPEAKGLARICLTTSSGGNTPFGCHTGSASVGWTTGSYFLAAGTYTLEVYVNSVDPRGTGTQVGGSVNISANKIAPAIFNVTGGGAACSGGATSVPIGLSNSEAGLTYQLLRNGTAVATYTSPSGGAFSFGSFNTPGTYTVATIAPCAVASMNGSAVITDPRPSSFTAWNDGPKCATDPAPLVNLSATNIPGATYYWTGPYNAHQTTSVNTTSVNGLAGTFDYTVYASINGCTTSTATTPVTLYPAPPQTFAGANQNLCALTTTLDASPAGTGFTGQWTQVSGPAQTQFQNVGAYNTTVSVTTPGTYVYRWTVSGASVCTPTTAQVSVTFNITPVVYAVTAGGSQRCSNASPITISLAGSQTGINYQLKINGANAGASVAGTGSALTWSDQGSGTYSIQAIGTGGCTQAMSGTPVITVNPAPAVYAVGGVGSVCSGSSFAITLSDSDVGVNYVLTRGATTVSTQAGTGNALSWDNQTLPGTYTVTATNVTSGCTLSMGSTAVTTNALPSLYTVSGGGTRCDNQPGLTVSLSGSQATQGTNVITYQLKRNNVNVGTPVTGTGSALTWTGLTDAGTYTVQANHSNGCTQIMTGTSVITVNPAPTLYTLGGGGAVCTGSPFAITLSGSDPGVNYVLTRGATTISTLAGTGSALSWGNQVLPGTFTITATNATSGCTLSMGSATVTLNALPSLYSVSGGGDRCDNQPGLTVSLNGSQVPQGTNIITYQLKLNNMNVGTAVTGTGSALNWAGLTDAGTYTIQAIHSNGCVRTMTNTATINTKTAPTLANAGPDINTCGEQVTLSANTPTVGTGAWTQVSGPVQSQFSNTLSPTTSVSVIRMNTYVYAWTITNSSNGCTSTDNVQVIFNASATTANAGPDQTICDDLFATMSGNTPLAGNGEWVRVSGPDGAVFFPDSNTPDAYLFAPEPGTYVYRWTITNQPCAPSTDDVQITFSTGCSARLASTGDARKQSALSESSELSSEAVQVYPVPASESITVEIPFEGTWKAELRNMNGALVKTLTSNERTSTLEVSEIPAGLYVLYIQGNSRRFIKKVEVVR